LSFDIFEIKCHATRAVGWHPKTFLLFCIFLKKSVVWRERSIRHQNIYMIFYIFEKECSATQAVD